MGMLCPVHRDEAAMNGFKSEMRGFFAALRMTNFWHSSLVGKLFGEEVEVDGFAHGFVAGVAGV